MGRIEVDEDLYYAAMAGYTRLQDHALWAIEQLESPSFFPEQIAANLRAVLVPESVEGPELSRMERD